VDGHGQTLRPEKAGSDHPHAQSRDVRDHIGLITTLCLLWKRRSKFPAVDFHELKSISIIEADRLLRVKFDPERSSASTFLHRFLVGRVEYEIGKSSGKRKHAAGWISPHRLDPPRVNLTQRPDEIVEWQDTLQAIHPDLRDVVVRISEGESLRTIATELFRIPIFNNISAGCSSIDQVEKELRNMIRSELRRIASE